MSYALQLNAQQIVVPMIYLTVSPIHSTYTLIINDDDLDTSRVKINL